MKTRRLLQLSSLLPFVMFLLAGCEMGTESDPQIIDDFVAVSGDGQPGRVNTVLPEPLVVQVNDTEGKPIRGVRIRWTVVAGTGSVSPAESVTDEDGQAEARWSLGQTLGLNLVLAEINEGGVVTPPVEFFSLVNP